MPINFRGLAGGGTTLPTASADGMALTSDAASSGGIKWAVQPGKLLKAVKYNPLAGHTYTINSVSAADLDATNLIATFTVPDSGNVIVVLSGLLIPDVTDNVQFCLRAGSSIIADSDDQVVRVQAGGSIPFDYRTNYRAYITGLTPGSVTWKWAAYGKGSVVVGGAADGSSTAGQALMEFYAA